MFRQFCQVVIVLNCFSSIAFGHPKSCESKINSLYQHYIVNKSVDISDRMEMLCRSVFGMWSERCDEYLRAPSFESALLEAQKKTYSLEQIKNELSWADKLLKTNEAERSAWFLLKDPEQAKQLRKLLQTEALKFFELPRFYNAYVLNHLLSNVGLDCEELRRNGFSCAKRIPVQDYQKYLDQIIRNISDNDTRTVGNKQLDDFRQISAYVTSLPLYEANQLHVDLANGRKLLISIPIKYESGFNTDQEFQTFFNRMKNMVENFWKGDYQTPSGAIVHIQVQLVLSDAQDATAIRVTTAKENLKDVAIYEGGYSILLNAISFKPKTFHTDSPRENHIIAHEIGHVLGFDDQYYLVNIDPTTCDLRYNDSEDEIMGTQKNWTVYPAIKPEELKFLYETYATSEGMERRNIFKNFIHRVDSIREAVNK